MISLSAKHYRKRQDISSRAAALVMRALARASDNGDEVLGQRRRKDRCAKDGGDIPEEAVEGRSGYGSPSVGRGERSPEAERIWLAGINPRLQEGCPRVLSRRSQGEIESKAQVETSK